MVKIAGRAIATKGESLALEDWQQRAKIDLLPADLHLPGEVAAFDVVVNGALIGRWVQYGNGMGAVTWTDGSCIETGALDGAEEKIIQAVRGSAPMPAEGHRYGRWAGEPPA